MLQVLLFLALCWTVVVFSSPSVTEHWFETVLDHFRFRSNETLSLRYFVNDDHWDGSSACFFYAGNEANIWQFVNNSGFLFEAASEFGALVVFAEHRYYGESSQVPGDDLSFLSVEQAMADFNSLNLHIRDEWQMPKQTAFVAFGGSYGGNLAMWLRLKNPNLWAGAIASSATPLKHLLRETNAFAQIETQVYANVSQKCPKLIRAGWRELMDGPVEAVAAALGLCRPIRHDERDHVHGWISNALETMVQYGYPYPTNFYAPVPAFPFRVACHNMLRANSGFGALRAAVNVYYNYTGKAGSCYKVEDMVVPQAVVHWGRKGRMALLDKHFDHEKAGIRSFRQSRRWGSETLADLQLEEAWGYQTCTEVYQPMPTNGVTDFEIPYVPKKADYFAYCRKRYDVEPRPDWEEMTFMGSHIQGGSNIFLTSGQLDPWRAAGIQKPPRGTPVSIVIRVIENGAHHLDLRAAHPLDPLSVVEVRSEEKSAIRNWIAQWKTIYENEHVELFSTGIA